MRSRNAGRRTGRPAARPPGSAPGRRHRVCGARPGLLLMAVLAAGCTAGSPPRHALVPERPAVPAAAGSLVKVPAAGFRSPASVAAAFYTGWAGMDTVHDSPAAFVSRCAALVTPALGRQLAASQPPTAAWQAMRAKREVSLVHVEAVTHPDGAPAATSFVTYLRVYALRVTTTTAGRTAGSDGISLKLTYEGGRWLVSAVLFY